MLIWTGWAIALVAGVLLGWGWRSWRAPTDSRRDWKTRLASRDEDVRNAQSEVAQITVRLHQVTEELETSRAERAGFEDPAVKERLETLESELADAERQIGELQARSPGRSADPDLTHRIEELEAEVIELASHRCPEPEAHAPHVPDADEAPQPTETRVPSNVVKLTRNRSSRDAASSTSAERVPVTPADDLSLISGLDESVEMVLAGMGVTTFRDVACLDDDAVTVLEDLLDEVVVDLESWSASARALHEEHHGESI